MTNTKKVSIFGVATRRWFEKSETVFQRQLEANPSHPFRIVEPNVYVFTDRYVVWYDGMVMASCTLLVTGLIYGLAGSINEYILFPLLLACYALWRSGYNFKWRTIVIYVNKQMYEYYKGKKLIYTGHIHNIYIRLKGWKTGGDDIIYNLVLDGFMLDEQVLSGSTVIHNKMARLGRRLAYKLDINFFDFQDKSRGHVVRHRCPYQVTFTPLTA